MKQMKRFDKQVNIIIKFKINDLILLENYRQVVGHVHAFEPKFSGPYKFSGPQKEDANYLIKKLKTISVEKYT